MVIPIFLRLIGIPKEVKEGVIIYGRIFALGFAIFGLMKSALSIYSAAGDTFTVMKIRLIGVSVSIVLDPAMIFGLFGFPALWCSRSRDSNATQRLIVRIHLINPTLETRG